MADLILIHKKSHSLQPHGGHVHVLLWASRATLAKRRWRSTAEDGKEFGFDLEEPLGHGAHFHVEGLTQYVLEQTPEEVLEIPVGTVEQAARIAWSLGNLHFGAQVLADAVRVTEDPAVLQLLEREGIAFKRVTCVYLPLSAGAHHHHPELPPPPHHHG